MQRSGVPTTRPLDGGRSTASSSTQTPTAPDASSETEESRGFGAGESAESPDTLPLDARWGPWGHSPHWHPRHQFLTAAAGSCVLTIGDGGFRVSRTRGVWIPRGVVHSAHYGEEFVALPFQVAEDGPTEPTVVEITTSLRRLLLAWQWSRRGPQRTWYEREFTRGLRQANVRTPLLVLEPTGELTGPVVAHLRQHPASDRTLAEWAPLLHTSVASLRRAFLAETGISYSQWRTRYRLNRSLPGLLAGRPIAVVAREVGFTNNGYTQAFRRHLGCLPSGFVTSGERAG